MMIDYPCSMWIAFYRTGRMYLSENFIAFSPVVGDDFIVPWKEVLTIKKRVNWGKASIVMETRQEVTSQLHHDWLVVDGVDS